MPFEFLERNRRIAVIGAGVSGLAVAYQLAGVNNVTLIEAAPRLGGHARTVLAGRRGDVPVDTGFIVFNYENYPHLTRMFHDLGVPVKKSNMSFSASIDNGAIEYGMTDLSAMAAQMRNIARPQFWRMFRDVMKFNSQAVALSDDPEMTLKELLDRMQMGEWFRKYYLLPMSGAIWSSTPEQMEDFPARALVQFFQNHSLLSAKTHQWYTVDGGSIQYVDRIAQAIVRQGGQIRTNAPVAKVRRHENGVTLLDDAGHAEEFDEVVFACHSDQALAMLEAPGPCEADILGRVRFQDNLAVLHRDPAQMPKRRRAWASWVYKSDSRRTDPRIGITYWMNSLQGIAAEEPMFVSLNPVTPVDERLVYDETSFRHPIFDRAALSAQADLPFLQGQQNTWYCGAWTRHGFHEDGFASGVALAERMQLGRMVA